MSTSAAITSLDRYGVCVIDNMLTKSLLDEVRGSDVAKTMPTSNSTKRATRQKPAHFSRETSEWRLSSVGRYHRREETFNEDDVKLFERVEAHIWPLVVAFFEEDKQGQGIFRSEMQILNAVPGSASQTWHSDNRSRGLSIIIPLCEFTVDNGGTQLLPGSHNKTWSLVAQQGAQVVEAPAGSIAAYDSRTYHRGLGNQTGEGRPALIFCYDRTSSPPPGCGTYGMIANASLAGMLNIVTAGWLTCVSAWKGGGV